MKVQPWKRVEPTVVTKIDYRHMVVKSFMVPGNPKPVTRATMLHEGATFAGVIALTPDNQVIIARQFRPGPEKIMEEIPGGGVEPGEDPRSAVLRELQEETGYVPGAIELLGVSSRESYTNGNWYYYFATDCTLSPGGTHLDEDEQVEVRLISIREFIENAKQNKMTDQAAVLYAYDRLTAMS